MASLEYLKDKWYNKYIMRKLLNGEYVNSYLEPIDLVVHTRAPGKWKLIDMETGQEYIGADIITEYGMWTRIKDRE